MGTKLEVTFVKGDGSSWPVLRSDDVRTGEVSLFGSLISSFSGGWSFIDFFNADLCLDHSSWEGWSRLIDDALDMNL